MKTKSLFYSYWIFQLRLILSITRFFFPVLELSLASALPLSGGFDRTFWTEIRALLFNNSASSSSPVMFGVPQGSVLGPMLFVLYTTPLSDIIATYSVNYQLFANDTQLQKSTSPNDVQSLTHDLQSCTDDIKAWMCNNQLKLDEDKTEAILFSTPSLSSCHCLITIASVHMKFCFQTKSGT